MLRPTSTRSIGSASLPAPATTTAPTGDCQPFQPAPSPTARLLGLLPGARELERAVSAGRLYDIVGEIFGRTLRRYDDNPDCFAATVRQLYERVVSTGVSLCSLQTLTEAIQIESLVHDHEPPHAQAVLNQLRSMQRETPRAIRFHVDVYGRPAYLKMS